MKLRVNPEDIKRGKVVDPGRYSARITTVSDKLSKPNEAGEQSMNTVVTFVITSGAFKDVPITVYFNEKAPGTVVPLLTALGYKVDEDAGFDVDLDESTLGGREVDIFVDNDLYQGRKVNKIVQYAPHR
jgi:hypothetical protein